MQARTHDDGSLLLTYDSAGLSVALFGFAAILIATAAYDYFIGPRGTDRLIGIIGGVATCGISGLMVLERVESVSIREPERSTGPGDGAFGGVRACCRSTTSRRSRRSGPLGDDGTPSRRIVVTTRDNRTVPLTVGYHSDADGELMELADRFGT